MGFDRPGEAGFIIPVSDTQAYKQFGNAVAIPVVEEIARFIKPMILDLKKHHGQMFLFTGTLEETTEYNG